MKTLFIRFGMFISLFWLTACVSPFAVMMGDSYEAGGEAPITVVGVWKVEHVTDANGKSLALDSVMINWGDESNSNSRLIQKLAFDDKSLGIISTSADEKTPLVDKYDYKLVGVKETEKSVELFNGSFQIEDLTPNTLRVKDSAGQILSFNRVAEETLANFVQNMDEQKDAKFENQKSLRILGMSSSKFELRRSSEEACASLKKLEGMKDIENNEENVNKLFPDWSAKRSMQFIDLYVEGPLKLEFSNRVLKFEKFPSTWELDYYDEYSKVGSDEAGQSRASSKVELQDAKYVKLTLSFTDLGLCKNFGESRQLEMSDVLKFMSENVKVIE